MALLIISSKLMDYKKPEYIFFRFFYSIKRSLWNATIITKAMQSDNAEYAEYEFAGIAYRIWHLIIRSYAKDVREMHILKSR
ncbi:MAG: hypothetical protein ACD_3C00086G0047 [uncultured bacterium (gcode 4)]|uniref:Uncharacterized protein n=1 Tax=uncultured bacterium (gcode 4) TaxID=1234023 RepID=K2FZ38_9BACT|nr:MAG: hypothetical protein ACD_3C00086G0047 [uncultured bacterium (gcode 4)]